MRVVLSQFRSYFSEIVDQIREGKEYGAFPSESYSSIHSMLFLQNDAVVIALQQKLKDENLDLFILTTLREILDEIINGAKDLHDFLTNEPASGEIAIDVAAIYHCDQLPKCIDRVMEDIDWGRERNLEEEMRSDDYKTYIHMLDKLRMLPNGKFIGRLLWD
ncbi:hypothetical protein [Chitinophaga barathri]|uniref:Uncharacterized protein n=1 Tax=Chitinophaga barathri TaxID=1647451 RepID=A0A3N4MHJ1_9BACT|nr:hypothetical protein [Chitinophaga barathri]RPD43068.1 hypothetical protein EG028_01895 [Chitinophaga barathri]